MGSDERCCPRRCPHPLYSAFLSFSRSKPMPAHVTRIAVIGKPLTNAAHLGLRKNAEVWRLGWPPPSAAHDKRTTRTRHLRTNNSIYNMLHDVHFASINTASALAVAKQDKCVKSCKLTKTGHNSRTDIHELLWGLLMHIIIIQPKADSTLIHKFSE
ncbi:hypothetical protein J3459_016417 [Metarhizium acridum]|nr:hypothetical protein J3459_016417 [Metarhizium acridum]